MEAEARERGHPEQQREAAFLVRSMRPNRLPRRTGGDAAYVATDPGGSRSVEANGVETWDSDQDDDPDQDSDLPFSDVMEMVAGALEICTAAALTERTLEAVEKLDELINDSNEGAGDSELFPLLFGVFLSWMIGARDSHLVDPDDAMTWMADAFGHDFTVRIVPLMGFLAPIRPPNSGN